MKPFVPKEKMSKKARKKLAAGKRGTWSISPVTRKIDSKKVYNRKRISRADTDDGAGDPLFGREKRASGGRSGGISGAARPKGGTGRRAGRRRFEGAAQKNKTPGGQPPDVLPSGQYHHSTRRRGRQVEKALNFR